MTASITVIIPVYNGGPTLGACLEGLQVQTHPPEEVIVVDDGSTDDTVTVAAGFPVRVLSQPKAGPAAARNQGALAAHGDLLLFTDADCVPDPAWVEHMAAPFHDPTVAGVKGEYRTRQPELVARFVQQEYQERYDRMAGRAQIDFVDTYAAAYRRDLFLAAGGFDPIFRSASVEDQEFSFRLAAQGQRLMYAAGAVVYHQHDRTLVEYIRRKFWIGYWKALVMRRYPAKLFLDSHTPQVLKLQMGLAAAGAGLLLAGVLGRSAWPAIAGVLAWLLVMLTGLSLYIKIWQRDTSVLRLAPLLVLVRALSLGCGFILGNFYFIFRRHI